MYRIFFTALYPPALKKKNVLLILREFTFVYSLWMFMVDISIVIIVIYNYGRYIYYLISLLISRLLWFINQLIKCILLGQPDVARKGPRYHHGHGERPTFLG